jgi:pilus assembly protein Flp/PilA
MMKRLLARAGAAEDGATAIEYGLIAGMAALALLTAYWTIGDSLQARFGEIAGAIGVEKQGGGGHPRRPLRQALRARLSRSRRGAICETHPSAAKSVCALLPERTDSRPERAWRNR